MAIRPELNIRLPNSPGALLDVCRALANERVNILAMDLDNPGLLRLVVDNHVHAAGVLTSLHYSVSARDVIVVAVTNGPGAIVPVLGLLADAGFNIDYAYGTGADSAGAAAIVLGVGDPMRAAAAAGI